MKTQSPKKSDKAAEKDKEENSKISSEKATEDAENSEISNPAFDDTVPEEVTNRMLKRIAFTMGLPLALGVAFFPFFYWLKVVQHVDLPEWVPFLSSILLFSSATLGISYGILSTSWDPVREGSLLGWKEAQVNWKVFFQTLKGKN